MMLRASLATLLPFALLFTAACGDDSGADVTGDAGSETPDGGQNPLGEGPAPVEIGLAGNLEAPGAYVLLAETGITNVTGSTITGGHLGVSPEVLETVTGFSLTNDASNQFSTADAVVPPGRIYASNHTAPTPSNLTLAVAAMRAAYTDAASRTNPDGLNLSDGILDGLTFAPGLYTWGTNVTIPGDITLAGAANDVWIFQVSGTLEISADKRVLITGGGQARNVFWQVADEVTIEPGAHFEGIILGQTGITLQTNATLVGRLYAQSLIAIDDNAIIAP
jgi:hypothetical protein